MRRLIGCGGSIDYAANVKPDFRLADGEAPVVMLEHLANIHGGLEVETRRTLVLRSVSDCDLTSTGHAKGAEWFFEDVVTHNLAIEGQRLWARQLNVENEGTHLVNDGRIVSSHDDGRARAINSIQQLHNSDAGVGVKVSSGLVGD